MRDEINSKVRLTMVNTHDVAILFLVSSMSLKLCYNYEEYSILRKWYNSVTKLNVYRKWFFTDVLKIFQIKNYIPVVKNEQRRWQTHLSLVTLTMQMCGRTSVIHLRLCCQNGVATIFVYDERQQKAVFGFKWWSQNVAKIDVNAQLMRTGLAFL